MENKNNFRKYGRSPYSVVVVHGGPGAPGDMKPVAEELSKTYGVLEPLQTADSVNGQIDELKNVIEQNGAPPVILIGWSWGAWLSYLLSAKYPNVVKKLILVSSGPFEVEYAKTIMPTRLSRLTSDEKIKVEKIIEELQKNENSGSVVDEFGAIMDKADTFDPIENQTQIKFGFQPEIYKKVWSEAEKLRSSGQLLKLAQAVKCPVVAIHGDYDPHPAKGVEEPLSRHLQNFRFVLLNNCGHTPWKEKQAKDRFYEALDKELKN